MGTHPLAPAVSYILVFCASMMNANEAAAARLLRASVSLDGKTLLVGSTSDDGHVDVDGVWECLKSIKFKATDNFAMLDVAPSTKEAMVSSEEANVIVEIAYGGKAFTRKLGLIRVPIDKLGREWSLVPAEVDGMFNHHRLIRRSSASGLENPTTLKD